MSESEDLRAFIRDLMARFDRGMDAVERKLERSRDENRRYFEALDRRAEEEAQRTRDLHAESLAQRQALLHILDELRGGNGGIEPRPG